jgi:NADPH:quinone reductase
LIGLSRLAPEETRAFTEDAFAEAAAGRLRPVIGQRFPLDRAADAHAAIESRATVGKTLLVT